MPVRPVQMNSVIWGNFLKTGKRDLVISWLNSLKDNDTAKGNIKICCVGF